MPGRGPLARTARRRLGNTIGHGRQGGAPWPGRLGGSPWPWKTGRGPLPQRGGRCPQARTTGPRPHSEDWARPPTHRRLGGTPYLQDWAVSPRLGPAHASPNQRGQDTTASCTGPCSAPPGHCLPRRLPTGVAIGLAPPSAKCQTLQSVKLCDFSTRDTPQIASIYIYTFKICRDSTPRRSF